jgi:hypothetical protein
MFEDLFEQGEWHFPFDIWEGIFKSENRLVPLPGRTASDIREVLEREIVTTGHRYILSVRSSLGEIPGNYRNDSY